MKRAFVHALVILSIACFAEAGERDWAETTVDDLHFIRATLRENHPGPVDPQNPQFRLWFEKGFRQAIERAQRTTTFAGYFFAINAYMAGFRDGHLGALAERHLADHLADARLERRWPQFIVGYDRIGFVVRQSEAAAANVPRAGDRLLSCDGRPAETLAEETIGEFVGMWFLPGERVELAPLLFVDEGNPFVARPRQCVFDTPSGRRTIALEWRPVTGPELLSKIAPPPSPGLDLRRIRDSYWISIDTFDLTNPKSGEALKALTDRVIAEASKIRASRIVVFDVRGNRGGASATGSALLRAIWGEEAVAAAAPRSAAIDWRVSAANIRFLRDVNLRNLRRQFGDDSPQASEYTAFLAEMEKALARGEALYRQTEAAPKPAAPPASAPVRPVLLTDNVCASACLDFADIVLRLPGADHYGLETSADALYIDNRAVTLPSGLGFLGFSMKVHRGRVRGNNEPYRPRHVWSGDIQDTPALERWILGN